MTHPGPGSAVPARSDPRLQGFLSARTKLIQDERSTRSDAAFRANLSPVAAQACRIVDDIRDHELRTVWKPDVEETMAKDRHEAIFPGMMFMLAKERLEGTKLWKIVRRMPKGCLLHSHMDAVADFEYLLDELMRLPGMHMSSDQPLVSSRARKDAKLSFRYKAKDRTEGNVWDHGYEPGTFILLTKVADDFPDGGRAGFLKYLLSRCRLSFYDAHEQHHGIDAIWTKFEKCFSVVGTMLHYEPMLRCLLRRMMSVLKADGVNWIETRITWPLNYCRDHHEEPESDYVHMFQVIDEEIARFRESKEGNGFWGMTFIWSSRRAADTDHLTEHMKHCIATKKRFPHLISGFDLVGPEDRGRPLDDLLPELFWFQEQCEKEGVRLPFFFHAGETLGDGDAVDSNLFDAILLGTRRIGHGYSLYKHPKLIDLVNEKRILVESCPISNEVLRLCGSILAHPLPALLARGVPCALCNDGPAMLGQETGGLSHDFWQALQGWHNLGLAGLGSIAENSIVWAAFEDQDDATWVQEIDGAHAGVGTKGVRLRQWRAEWEEFCEWIVREFGQN